MKQSSENYVRPSVEVVTMEMGSVIAQSVASVGSDSFSLSGYEADEEDLF